MRITRYAASAAVAGLILAGCASEAGNEAEEAAENTAEVQEDVEFEAGTTMAELNEAGTVTVGTKFDQPGFGLLNPDGVPEGFDVEIAKIVAAELGIAAEDIEWTETVSANREPFIQNGQVDFVVATYTINDTRKQVVDFAGPYYVAGQDIMVAAGSPEDFELVGNPFTEEPYGIGLAKGDDEFRTFINDVLEEAYESGAWAEAWDRTAGAITDTEAPEPPDVDRY
jgi:glutamate transport system substrate-binding protein